MRNSNDFFRNKKDWSRYKDKVLASYLLPYFQKILTTNKDSVFIDGFAGKGCFEDGNKGSPILVAEIIETALKNTKSKNKIDPYFIEYKYAKELQTNLKNYGNVISGDYKVEVLKLLENNQTKNIFLYVDPFGIKHLHYNVFEKLSQNKNSVELLVNLNSFGFIREGCRLLNVSIDEELNEYAVVDEVDDAKNSIENMNKIAGGDYWQNIIDVFKLKSVNAKKAEAWFVNEYMKRLGEDFEYIFQFAIKTSDKLIPKYRMVFATNHIQGALIMSDTMIKCDIEMSSHNRNNQQSFFDHEYTKMDCKDSIMEILEKVYEMRKVVDCKDLCMLLYRQCGPRYLHRDFTKALLELEENKLITVKRQTSFTPTGKQSKALPFIKENIFIKLN